MYACISVTCTVIVKEPFGQPTFTSYKYVIIILGNVTLFILSASYLDSYNKLDFFFYRCYLAVIYRAGGLYGRILIKVVSTE